VYVIGGNNSSNTSITTVQYAAINSNGSLGSWSTTTSLSTAVVGHKSVVYNGYVYAIGVANMSPIATVQYAKINSDGTLGSWSTTTSLSTAVAYHTSVAYNGYMYIIGGVDGISPVIATVQYAPINSNGSIGSWSTTTSLSTAVSTHTSVENNGYIYAIGGSLTGGTSFTNAVQYAKINSDGTIGSWSTTTSLPTVLAGHTSVLYNGYIYAIDGVLNSTTLSSSVQVGTLKVN